MDWARVVNKLPAVHVGLRVLPRLWTLIISIRVTSWVDFLKPDHWPPGSFWVNAPPGEEAGYVAVDGGQAHSVDDVEGEAGKME